MRDADSHLLILVGPGIGGQESKPDPKSPLGCLLKNLPAIDPGLKRKRLIFLMARLFYQFDNHETWTPEGTFDFVTLTDLDNLCKRSEVPYIQSFWALCSCPDLCAQCSTAQVLLARRNSDPYSLLSQLPQKPLPPFDSLEDLVSPLAPPPPYQLPTKDYSSPGPPLSARSSPGPPFSAGFFPSL